MLCMYVGVLFRVKISLQTQKGKCLALLILSYSWRGGVWTEQERQLDQTEDEFFDLAGQIMALGQTTKYSPEEEQELATMWEWEDQLMMRAEDLQKRIAKAEKGIGIPGSTPKGLEQEAEQKVGQWQVLGR